MTDTGILDFGSNRLASFARLMLVLIVQAAGLIWMIADRAAILRDGAEITLSVVPVDPRDFFRGDYVRLNYDISSVPVDRASPEAEAARGDTVYVLVRPDADGNAKIVRASLEPVAETGALMLRGRVTGKSSRATGSAEPAVPCPSECDILRVDYGIERFYVPEGKGKPIETDTREGRVAILAAVAEDGEVAIKQLLIEGEPIYSEPMF